MFLPCRVVFSPHPMGPFCSGCDPSALGAACCSLGRGVMALTGPDGVGRSCSSVSIGTVVASAAGSDVSGVPGSIVPASALGCRTSEPGLVQARLRSFQSVLPCNRRPAAPPSHRAWAGGRRARRANPRCQRRSVPWALAGCAMGPRVSHTWTGLVRSPLKRRICRVLVRGAMCRLHVHRLCPVFL